MSAHLDYNARHGTNDPQARSVLVRQELILQVARQLGAVISRRVSLAVGLWGEPGIGKTHAAREVLSRIPCRHLSLHATASGLQIASGLPRARTLPGWAQAQLDRLGRGEHLEPDALAQTLAVALERLAPFVLHLEDIHEADAVRLGLIGSLARAVARTRGVGLLTTSRAEPPEPFLNHQLVPFSEAETAALLQQELNADAPQDALEWLVQRTRGNPLFTLEFARYLRRQGFLWSDGARWRWREPPSAFVPVTVEPLVLELVAQATTTSVACAVLEARSILPMDLHSEALETGWSRVAGVEGEVFDRARMGLERAGVLAGVNLQHPLFAEVIARRIPVDRRRVYAQRAVAAFEETDPERAVAFSQDAGLPQETVLSLLERATESLQRINQPARMGALLARMADLSEGERRARHALEAARKLKFLDQQRALELTEWAMSEASTRQDALFLRAQLLAAVGRLPQALEELAHAPIELRGSQRHWEAQIMAYHLARKAQDVIRIWEEGSQFQASAQPHVAVTVASWMAYLGRHEAALELAARCLRRDDLDLDARCRLLETSIIVHGQRGEHAECERLASQGLEWLGAATDHPLGPSLLRSRARARVNLNQFDQAARDYRAALRLHAQSGDAVQHARLLGCLAEIDIHRAEFERAELMLLEAHEVLERHDAPTYLVSNGFYLTHLYQEWRPPHGPVLALSCARQTLDRARTLGTDQLLQTALFYAASTEAEFGAASRALGYALELQSRAEASGLAHDLPRAALALGLALEASGRRHEALDAYTHAFDGYSALGVVHAVNRVGLELDRLHGNATRARERCAVFEANGWLAHARTARRYFPEPSSDMLAPGEPARPARLKVLGPMLLEFDGQAVSTRARKRLEILAYLLETRIAGRAEASALELIDAIYPGESEPEARNTLKQQVYLIRLSLGAESVLSTPGGYALGSVSSDAEDILRSNETALWRGPYLSSLGEGWLPGVRAALTLCLRSRIEALLIADAREAARLGAILLEMEPFDAAALHLAVRALESAGDLQRARRVYLNGRARLREVGASLPETFNEFVTELGAV